MVESFIKYLQLEKRFSPHTITAYSKDLQQFSEFLAATFEISKIEKAEHPHLRSWVVHLMDTGVASRTVNRKIVSLKSFYKFLQRREFIEVNPASRLKSLRVPKDLANFVKESEMDNLLDHLTFKDNFSGQRDKLLLEMLYATGMRLSELIGLRNESINYYEKTVKVLGKRNKERIIPLHQEVIDQVEKYKQLKSDVSGKSDKLLTTNSGNDLYPQFVYKTVKNYLTQVTTLSKRSPHVLRHTFATHLLNKGADLNAVKDLLGHASLASTQVYTHNSIKKLKAVFDQAHPKA
ncbi:MAG: tyrosine-type recombinase/integrase [Cytophagales bacterium]|nr:tyrosine-type recombinase/integrase [Cytophagales bacterium]